MLELKGIRLQPLDQTDEVPERGLVGCCLAAGQDISDQSEGAFLRGSSNQRDVIWPHEIGSVVVWIEDAGVDVVDADAVIEGLERGNAALPAVHRLHDRIGSQTEYAPDQDTVSFTRLKKSSAVASQVTGWCSALMRRLQASSSSGEAK